MAAQSSHGQRRDRWRPTKSIDKGIGMIAAHYRLGPADGNQPSPRDVKFTADEFRRSVEALRNDEVGAPWFQRWAPRRRFGTMAVSRRLPWCCCSAKGISI